MFYFVWSCCCCCRWKPDFCSSRLQEQLDVALSKTCKHFDVLHYTKVQLAYTLLGKTQVSGLTCLQGQAGRIIMAGYHRPILAPDFMWHLVLFLCLSPSQSELFRDAFPSFTNLTEHPRRSWLTVTNWGGGGNSRSPIMSFFFLWLVSIRFHRKTDKKATKIEKMFKIIHGRYGKAHMEFPSFKNLNMTAIPCKSSLKTCVLHHVLWQSTSRWSASTVTHILLLLMVQTPAPVQKHTLCCSPL